MGTVNPGNCLFLGSPPDKSGVPPDQKYVSFLKPLTSSCPSTFVILKDVEYLAQITDYCKSKGVTKIISTNKHFLYKLLERDWPSSLSRKRPAISDYAGSVFPIPGIPGGEVVFVNPLKQCYTVPYGKFILERFVSKLTGKGGWNEPTAFSFTVCDTPESLANCFSELSKANFISIDIETLKTNAVIACVGYCGVFVDTAGSISTKCFVLPFTSTYNLAYVRKINSLPCPKIFQNGKYDNAYFLRFNCPVVNWVWDTAHLFHCWYSELPKDLGFLNAFFLRNVQYWKDLAKVGDKYLYYKYNALDCWATANVFLIQMAQMPAWAHKNYTLEFPLVFPCLLSELTGVRRSKTALAKAIAEDTAALNKAQSSLDRMLGTIYFNTNSSLQMAGLFKVLGLSSIAEISKIKDGEYVDAESYGEKIIEKAMFLNPFAARILQLVLDIRGIKKNLNTYLTTGEEAKEFYAYGTDPTSPSNDGRLLYSINPHQSDTGRCVSRESAYWCGFNFQTAPRESNYKSTIAADDGFLFAECDLKQAESRDLANISGDQNLLNALDSENDFHAWNAHCFFGVPYEDIFDNAKGKAKNKPLRDLSKRTNHGAGYNMGPDVMVDTMGLKRVTLAVSLLHLPPTWKPRQVTAYLLERFHVTYKGISGVYYPWVVRSVLESSRLTSRVMHSVSRTEGIKAEDYIREGDWTRYCFGSPDKNKRDLNAYVAHCPQSLNARTLNESYLRVFYDLALGNPEFRLYAQIHDSIFFGFKAGKHIYYCAAVKERMEIPVTILSCDKKYRTFTVPADIKAGRDGIGATHWNLTE
jgi:hypothetical protein